MDREIRRHLKHINSGGVIDNPAQMFLPKSKEEEKLDKLNDMSKEIVVRLLESRKMEIEIVAEKSFMMSSASVNNLKIDLEKLNSLINEIKNGK